MPSVLATFLLVKKMTWTAAIKCDFRVLEQKKKKMDKETH
jgi:hypothetical protein